MSSVLIVDDEPAICWAFREALTDEGHSVRVAASAEEALELTGGTWRPDVVVMDVRLPGMDGLSAMRQLRERIGASPVVVMTAFGSLETAVRAMEGGAYEYLIKPFDLESAVEVLRRALGTSQQAAGGESDANHESHDLSLRPDAIIGSSPVMQQVFKQIAQVASSDVSVLITGESGTGKELVARAVHKHSLRREGPFLPVCLPALNPGLVENELFGHVRGSFTGAAEERAGLFEMAGGGTLLLDEVADIPPAVQVKLLRAIEQREVLPVGANRARTVDVRILAATNRPLPDLISSGAFREDLFFRLGVFQIHLPALRERPEDIEALARHFLEEIVRPPGAAPWALSADACDELRSRPWAGNVRELRNAMERAAIVARSGEIRIEHLPRPAVLAAPAPLSAAERTTRDLAAWTANEAESAGSAGDPQLYERFLELVEPPLLKEALQHCEGNRAAAALLLGLHRSTLRQKLRRHGLS